MELIAGSIVASEYVVLVVMPCDALVSGPWPVKFLSPELRAS